MLTKRDPQKIVPIGDAVLSIEDWAKYLGISTDTILQWEEEFGCNGMAIKIAECWQSQMPDMPLEQAIKSLRRSQEHIKHLHLKKSKDDVQAFDVVIAAAEKGERKYVEAKSRIKYIKRPDAEILIARCTKLFHSCSNALGFVQGLTDVFADYGVVIESEE